MGFAIQSLKTRAQTIHSDVRGGFLSILFLAVGLSLLAGCASSSQVEANVITVSGEITVRGNVPFHEVVLITEDNNWYVLELPDNLRESLRTPARASVTGVIRLGDWNGRPFTIMSVREMVPVQ